MIKKIFPVAITAVVLFAACSKDNGGAGGTTTLDCSTVTNKAFAADVNPIIQSSCSVSNCHATGSSNGPGALTTYPQIFNARTNIRTAVASGFMPKNSTLSTAQKNSILCWIDGGALNN